MEYSSGKNRREEILDVAFRLFLRQGYEKTSMRQIASTANVSLGLVTYHFKNKSEMAIELVRRKYAQFSQVARGYVDRERDPVLYSALLVRLNYTVFSSPRFFHFYRDALREDIVFEVLADSDVNTDLCVRAKYFPEMEEEEARQIGLYGNYISVSMERTLVLYGQAKALLEEPIPDSIFRSYVSMWHLPNEAQVVEESCRRSRELVEQIVYEHPELYD